MEEVFEEDIVYVCDFEIGDKVVYPHHGAGLVMTKESRELMGSEREYLTIKILHNELTVMVPTENAGKAGLRRVIDEEEIKKVTTVLTDDVSEMPKNWNRRFKYNREKIKTGDVFELAEVVRNLAIREMEKGLSTGEKQMYTRAKKILASEFMYALDKDEEGAEEYLDGLLEERYAATVAPPEAITPEVTAVIAAAGSGERLGAGGPKAFVPLGGRPMVSWSLDACRACGMVRAIVVAVPAGHEHGLDGVDGLVLVDGASTRAESGRKRAGRGGDRVRRDPRRGAPAADGGAARRRWSRSSPPTPTRTASSPRPRSPTRSRRSDGAIEATEIEHASSRHAGSVRLWGAQTPQVFRTDALRAP